MNMNRPTLANILAHADVNVVVEDITTLYGSKGAAIAAKAVKTGLLVVGSRNGFATYNLTAAGRAAYSA